MNYKRKSRCRFFLLMRSRTPPISSEFRRGEGFNPPLKSPNSIRHWWRVIWSLTILRQLILKLHYIQSRHCYLLYFTLKYSWSSLSNHKPSYKKKFYFPGSFFSSYAHPHNKNCDFWHFNSTHNAYSIYFYFVFNQMTAFQAETCSWK